MTFTSYRYCMSKIDTSKADEVPGRLLKEGAQWIAGPLFSLSLAQGKLPQDWTSANVTPILKKGNKHTVLNYRPVSLTCITVKLLEHIVFNHMTKFLTTNKKLSPFQYGFRSGHLCQTQLLETVHQWAKTLDNNDSTHIIYLDFSKAFDTVPHQRLSNYSSLTTLGYGVNCLNGSEVSCPTVSSVSSAMGSHLTGRMLFQGCHKVQYLAPYYLLYMSTTLETTSPLTPDSSRMTVPSSGMFPHSKTMPPYKKM